MTIIKKYALLVTVVLNIILTLSTLWYMTRIQHMLSDVVGVLGESRVLAKNPDGTVFVNKVVTVADVQNASNVQRPNGVQ